MVRLWKNRWKSAIAAVCGSAILLSGCGSAVSGVASGSEAGAPDVVMDDAFGTTYEIFVGSFADSDGDGIGDLNGIREHLDYLNDGDPASAKDLGVNAVWITPVFPSPTYHKYDAADYCSIDPDFGSLSDFDALLKECHDRGVRLYMDLAFNHTSVEHPWFSVAADYLRQLPADEEPDPENCPYVDYYLFSRTPESGYAPLYLEDGSTETGWYYEARFWSGMPDLNLDAGVVRGELAAVMKFWIDRGIDGFRLDAVTSYYTEDHTQTAEFLAWLAQTAHGMKDDIYLVAEAWENQDAYAALYESGVDSFFDFAFAGQEGTIAQAVRSGKGGKKFGAQMAAEEALYSSYLPPESDALINAPFYTNHDMARSAGYYAKEGAPRTKLAFALNLLQTGNAFVYYGEELGMRGSGKDENKRAPFPWDAASGDNTKGPSGMDDFDSHPAGTLAEQQEDGSSIYRYCREAVHLRARHPLIARGRTEVLEELTDETVSAFYRCAGETPSADDLLILVNFGKEERTIDVKAATGRTMFLVDSLAVADEPAQLTGGWPFTGGDTLTLPGYGIAVLE